ncbi:MAG: hypothetical protein PVJ57_09020 [Phycisphaerae bacterium]
MRNLLWDLDYRNGWFRGGENLALDLLQQEDLKQIQPEREFRGVYLPMLYCYRHYLEVSLKFLIEDAHSIIGDSDCVHVKVDLQKEHGLMPLWNEAKRQMVAALGEPPDPTDDTDKQVERLINEFHQFDPRSQTFRYRRDKRGRTQENSIPRTDLEQLVKTMRALRNFFGGVEDCVDQARQYLADLSADVPDETDW